MEANTKEKKEEIDNDFNLIYNELKRQYDTLLKSDDSHDLKAGVILGFIAVVIAQITLSNEYINIVAKNPCSFGLFLVGFAFILASFVFGILVIRLRDFSLGPKIPILYKQWYYGKQGEKFNRAIFSDIYTAHKENKNTIQDKTTLIQWMFGTFASGMVFIVLSRIVLAVVQYA